MQTSTLSSKSTGIGSVLFLHLHGYKFLWSEPESISRNSSEPDIVNETHSEKQQQIEEENTRQELTEDEILSQGTANLDTS